MAARGIVWSQEETAALLDIWKEDHIKRQLSATHKNMKVFLLFSESMKKRGYNRTALQCRVKVKKMRQKYMNTRDKIRASGESAEIKETCPFFEELDEILGTSACANPTEVLEGGSVDLTSDEEQEKDGSSVAEGNSNPDESDASANTSGSTDPPPVVKRPSSKLKHPNPKSTITEVASMISSIIEQQRRDFELFVTKEDERHRREMELERERLRLQMEMEERRRQAQMESDQAIMRMVAQVMGAAISHTSPIPTHFPTPTCTTEEIPTFHLLTPAHQSSPMPSTNNQEASTHGTNELPLSSVLHEINRFNS